MTRFERAAAAGRRRTLAAGFTDYSAEDVRRVALASGRGATSAMRAAASMPGWRQAEVLGVPINWDHAAHNLQVGGLVDVEVHSGFKCAAALVLGRAATGGAIAISCTFCGPPTRS